jgi:hypothetical protein
MTKAVIKIIYAILIFFVSSVYAQDDLKVIEAKDTKRDTKTLSITSLDGKSAAVTITPDYANKTLTIASLKSAITIVDFWGVTPEIHVLNKNFVEINYEIRGGSNVGSGNIMVICVDGGKLYEAMHILRQSNSEYGDLKTNYNIKVILNGNNKNNFKLNVTVHDDVYSKQNPERNYIYNNHTILNFDAKRNAFYSIKKDVYNHKPKQRIAGNFPVIILGKESYYLINNRWYQPDDNNEMVEFH